jgi:hypothetical protein
MRRGYWIPEFIVLVKLELAVLLPFNSIFLISSPPFFLDFFF